MLQAGFKRKVLQDKPAGHRPADCLGFQGATQQAEGLGLSGL